MLTCSQKCWKSKIIFKIYYICWNCLPSRLHHLCVLQGAQCWFPCNTFSWLTAFFLIRMCSRSSWNSAQMGSGRPSATSWSLTSISSSSPSTRSGGTLRYPRGLFINFFRGRGVTRTLRHSYMQRTQAGHLSTWSLPLHVTLEATTLRATSCHTSTQTSNLEQQGLGILALHLQKVARTLTFKIPRCLFSWNSPLLHWWGEKSDPFWAGDAVQFLFSTC